MGAVAGVGDRRLDHFEVGFGQLGPIGGEDAVILGFGVVVQKVAAGAAVGAPGCVRAAWEKPRAVRGGNRVEGAIIEFV